MPNTLLGQPAGWDAPAQSLRDVTPNDNADLPEGWARCLRVGGAGNIRVIAADDTAPVTLTNCAAGEIVQVSVRRVYATGTTATNIVAFR